MKRRNIFIPKPIWTALQTHSHMRDVSTSELIREILTAWLQKNKKAFDEAKQDEE